MRLRALTAVSTSLREAVLDERRVRRLVDDGRARGSPFLADASASAGVRMTASYSERTSICRKANARLKSPAWQLAWMRVVKVHAFGCTPSAVIMPRKVCARSRSPILPHASMSGVYVLTVPDSGHAHLLGVVDRQVHLLRLAASVDDDVEGHEIGAQADGAHLREDEEDLGEGVALLVRAHQEVRAHVVDEAEVHRLHEAEEEVGVLEALGREEVLHEGAHLHAPRMAAAGARRAMMWSTAGRGVELLALRQRQPGRREAHRGPVPRARRGAPPAQSGALSPRASSVTVFRACLLPSSPRLIASLAPAASALRMRARAPHPTACGIRLAGCSTLTCAFGNPRCTS